jgi:hypothetical protein
MNPISRRSFIGPAATGLIALGTAGSEAEAQLVYQPADWKIKEFEQLARSPTRVKQVFDVTTIADPTLLNPLKNALNGLHFGFGVPLEQIQIVAALHGPANMLNYDDYVWSKYRVGEWLNVTDPENHKPVTRNPRYPSKAGKELRYSSQDPNNSGSSYQDISIQGLQARGVKFLSCHTAAEMQARMLIEHWKLDQDPEDVVKELQAHVWPGVLVVPAMVAALAMLQIDGHYAYTTA